MAKTPKTKKTEIKSKKFKDLAGPQKKLSADEMRKIKGGAVDAFSPRGKF